MPTQTREILFVNRPLGEPTLEVFALASRELRDPGRVRSSSATTG
jgi:hypothetical protein